MMHPLCVGAMDTFAHGLLCASKLLDDGAGEGSFDSGIGAKIEKGKTNFEELEVSKSNGKKLTVG